MPNQTVIFSFVANDQPGIVSQLATIVKNHSGNWLESQLSHLNMLFAGLVSISIDESHIPAFKTALQDLTNKGVDISRFEILNSTVQKPVSQRLELIGPDRSGIIQEISQALANMNVNILSMQTDISSAPMSGELLFAADIVFNCETERSETLAPLLDEIAEKLTLDVTLSEITDA